jgi:hypothetical protein
MTRHQRGVHRAPGWPSWLVRRRRRWDAVAEHDAAEWRALKDGPGPAPAAERDAAQTPVTNPYLTTRRP